MRFAKERGRRTLFKTAVYEFLDDRENFLNPIVNYARIFLRWDDLFRIEIERYTLLSLRKLQERLIARVREQVCNGDITERKLARLTGFSQPHIHHVLKGARNLTPSVFDALLEELNLSLLDLCTPEELEAELRKKRPAPKPGSN